MEENGNDFRSESHLAHYLRLEFLGEAERNNFFVDKEDFINHILKSTNPFFKAIGTAMGEGRSWKTI